MHTQEILDLKQASDKARLRSWDVFKSLYTIDSSSTELNFVGQRLDDEGAVIVADTIDVFSSLQTLNLSENMVAAKGMEALSSDDLVHVSACVLHVCMTLCACERAYVCNHAVVLWYMLQATPVSERVSECACMRLHPIFFVLMHSTSFPQDVVDLAHNARKQTWRQFGESPSALH